MCPLPLLNEGELTLRVRYSLDSDEPMAEAVVNALDASGVAVLERPTQLADWIDTDVFENLEWNSERPLYLSTRVWDRRVVMTPEEVRVYNSRDLR